MKRMETHRHRVEGFLWNVSNVTIKHGLISWEFQCIIHVHARGVVTVSCSRSCCWSPSLLPGTMPSFSVNYNGEFGYKGAPFSNRRLNNKLFFSK